MEDPALRPILSELGESCFTDLGAGEIQEADGSNGGENRDSVIIDLRAIVQIQQLDLSQVFESVETVRSDQRSLKPQASERFQRGY